MSDSLIASAKAASHGLFAQSTRMRILSENIANAETTGTEPGSDPYRRKTVSFENELDQANGMDLVQVGEIGQDQSQFRTEYRPGHPAADANGYVKLPNVDVLVELTDMREASRGYTANTQVIKQVKDMVSMTIDLLRA